MPPSIISFLADCPVCHEKVSVTTILGRADLTKALAEDADVRVVHMAARGDHQWSLTKRQKAIIGKRMAEGLV
jgi:hypothetical protein